MRRITDDTLNVTCATVEEGVLPGSGVTLLKVLLIQVINTPGPMSLLLSPDAQLVSTTT